MILLQLSACSPAKSVIWGWNSAENWFEVEIGCVPHRNYGWCSTHRRMPPSFSGPLYPLYILNILNKSACNRDGKKVNQL